MQEANLKQQALEKQLKSAEDKAAQVELKQKARESELNKELVDLKRELDHLKNVNQLAQSRRQPNPIPPP